MPVASESVEDTADGVLGQAIRPREREDVAERYAIWEPCGELADDGRAGLLQKLSGVAN